jgi:hypothetical protein
MTESHEFHQGWSLYGPDHCQMVLGNKHACWTTQKDSEVSSPSLSRSCIKASDVYVLSDVMCIPAGVSFVVTS